VRDEAPTPKPDLRPVEELPRIEALSVSEWLTAATRAWATRWVV